VRIYAFALLALSFSQLAHAGAKPVLVGSKVSAPIGVYSDEVCEDFQKIAGEFIDMELAGLRWQGVEGDPSCLTKLKPATAPADRVPASEFIIPENRKVDFSVKRLPNDLLEVVMNYLGKKNKKDIPVKDHFVLKLNFGHQRDLKGCASWYSEPEHFVMRSRCWKD